MNEPKTLNRPTNLNNNSSQSMGFNNANQIIIIIKRHENISDVWFHFFLAKHYFPFGFISLNASPRISFIHQFLDHAHECFLHLPCSSSGDWTTWNPNGICIVFTPWISPNAILGLITFYVSLRMLAIIHACKFETFTTFFSVLFIWWQRVQNNSAFQVFKLVSVGSYNTRARLFIL